MNQTTSLSDRRRRRLFFALILVISLGVGSWIHFRVNANLPADSAQMGNVAEAAIADASESPGDVVSEPQPSATNSEARNRELWTILSRPDGADAIEAEVAAPAHQFHYVQANERLLRGKQSIFARAMPRRVVMPLPDGRQLEVILRSTQVGGPDRYTSAGEIEGVVGSRVMLAYVQGELSASIEGVPPGEIKLRTIATDEGPVMQMYAVDPGLVPDCGADKAIAPSGLSVATVDVDSGGAAADEVPASSEASIDILMVYTSAVRSSLGGTNNVLAEIDLSIIKTNADFANSGLSARIRLAGTMEVEYAGDEINTGSSGWQSTMLERLSGVTDGFMDDVHARRDAVGADLVTVVQRRGDPSSSGIAYILNELGNYIEPFYSFAVVNYASFSDSTLLSHELGHNLGCAHAREEAFAGSVNPSDGYHGAFSHSYGYRVTARDTTGADRQIRSIMAYSPGTRISYFSSPETLISTYNSSGTVRTFAQPVALGIAEGPGGESADNVRTIKRTAFQVAGYRLSPNASNAGKLTNVSTRAFVGAGFQTLTGGFVVQGPGNKQVLIRAPGPAIGAAPFNVPGALTDSVLRVNAIGVGLAGENDDWSLPASNGTSVASAGQQVGAFALANGSKDAALVLDLPSGSYTAEVTGAAGAEGIALIEAYEVGGGAESRVINLSTRAYASVETPIIAGFVVQADATNLSAPKKMFIRVRGPSLVNYGLPEATVMADPIIEIYDANAQLIYFNDDWDSPSADIDGSNRNAIPIVRRGVVDRLSEQQVFDAATAVGVADMKPTEPGVVIEMPPGLYTVLVKPFEELPDQPAVPGVAIIEVYELND
jgi:hypothetical protein